MATDPAVTHSNVNSLRQTSPKSCCAEGRKELLRLCRTNSNLSLVAPSGAGKTSFLEKLSRAQSWGTLDSPVTAYVDFGALQDASEQECCSAMAAALRQAVTSYRRSGISLPPAPSDGTQGFAYLKELLSCCEAWKLYVRLLLDHFDLTEANPALTVFFFGALRSICSSHHVSFVCASRKPLWAINGVGTSLSSPLHNVFVPCRLLPERAGEPTQGRRRRPYAPASSHLGLVESR